LFISGYRAPHLPNPDLPVHQLPCDEFEMQLRRLHGTPEEVLRDKELMQIMMPLLRADFAIHETYSYRPSAPLDCPISAFGGWNDDHASYEELDLWRQHTRNRFNLQMFDGDHFFLKNARLNILNSISQELVQLL
jgi:medium-chain acyl-[acyl-carrier-protein] hydrolase